MAARPGCGANAPPKQKEGSVSRRSEAAPKVREDFWHAALASRTHPPVALERAADVVGRGVGHDDLGAASVREDDGVLPEDPAERDGLVPVHAVDEPRGLAPDAVG